MNIAVYSGSFNPLHIGHLAIIRHLLEVAGFDYVYLIVSPKNPLKEGISSDSGRARYSCAIEAVGRHFSSRVKVDDIELNMPEPHYTIRTLDALKDRESDNRFTLVMGADNLCDIRRWRDYSRILKDYGTVVFPRRGFDMDKARQDLLDEDPAYRITLTDAPLTDISSTEIRKMAAEGQNVSDFLM